MFIDDETYQALMEDMDLNQIHIRIQEMIDEDQIEEMIKAQVVQMLDDSGVDSFYIEELADLIYSNYILATEDDVYDE